MGTFEENLKNKLTTIGFKNHNLVIDAACGTGEWSGVLSTINKKVIGYDSSIGAIKTAQKNFSQINNINFAIASLTYSPIRYQKADAIICADSLMFVNPITTLNSFYNELNENGIVYLSVNGPGWILNCIFNRGIKNQDVSKINMGVKIIFDTLIRRFINPNYKVTNTVYTLSDLTKLASKIGFKILYAGYEGTYLNPEFKFYQPLFKKSFWGITQSIEIILKKIK
ncbi:MAG: class I SAM-dependent methyltransferase [Ignavibacteria bacterium]|nr:class I SAM-dependent methyltransferase [Ignavibacteria bacterium]